jgi:pSer/pThr/pTyr-binding forkhead associated (FHA) protein
MPDEEATGLLSGDPYGTDYYTGSDATHMLGDDDATGLLVDPGDETGLLVESRVSVRYPTLLRCSTNETILINKPVFRLGKEQSYVDYFVANNVMVSRSHADVITRSGRYFVKDLNSTNHTYINEREVPPQCEMELQDGDLLRLGNEEFVFHI